MFFTSKISSAEQAEKAKLIGVGASTPCTFTVGVIGDALSGKSSIIERHHTKKEPRIKKDTDYHKPIEYNVDGINVTLNTFEYGQVTADRKVIQLFESAAPAYSHIPAAKELPNTLLYILCFAKNSRSSLTNLDKWISEILAIKPHARFLLVYTKGDLAASATTPRDDYIANKINQLHTQFGSDHFIHDSAVAVSTKSSSELQHNISPAMRLLATYVKNHASELRLAITEPSAVSSSAPRASSTPEDAAEEEINCTSLLCGSCTLL